MTQAKSGDTIRIHYTGTLKSGEVFDSSQGRDPLEFTLGSGMIIGGLDAAIQGMAVGETKVAEIACAEAYGPINPAARQPVPRSEFPDDIPTQVGTQLQMQSPEGQVIPVTIVDVSETEVTLDANHPLAGKDLTFDFEVVGIDAA
uniref:FKBP-type peptidyl-prolyl cis-trans isomerase n=1 Tax=Yoonia sp. TaxID=2212373 RepID=UPI004048ADBA|tara:strand:+ start:22994 stop:23428 length:435 start_codon:yes stop_codon:yes gene_type:complete